MQELEFYFDEDGTPCAKGEDERLARFFETDVQGSIEIAEELLALLASPEESEFIGNAHVVNIDPKTVCLCNQLDEEAADRRLSREDFSEALEAWAAFIKAS